MNPKVTPQTKKLQHEYKSQPENKSNNMNPKVTQQMQNHNTKIKATK